MFSKWFVSRKDYDEAARLIKIKERKYIVDKMSLQESMWELVEELDKYKRKRDNKGRFVKG